MNVSQSLTYSISAFFKEELKDARGISKNTYRNYGNTIERFTGFLEKRLQKTLAIVQTDELKYEHISEWMIAEKQRHDWLPATWNRHLAALKTFVKFLAKSNVRYLELSSRVELIQSQRSSKKNPSYLTLEQFEEVVRPIKSYRFKDFRDKLLFQILFFSGMRVEELTGVRLLDVVWKNRFTVAFNLMGKGRKERTIYIKEKSTLVNLRSYLNHLTARGITSDYLFPNRSGKRMSEQNVRRIVKKHFGYLENKNITPHSFRHSAAMHWLENGMGIYKVSILLGHEDISTTTRYLRGTMKIKNEALIAAGMDKDLSHKFKINYGSNQEFWESLGIRNV